MRRLLIVTGMIAATSIPTLAFAQSRCEQDQANRKTTGTVLGALAGGLVGNAVSHGGGRTGGTVIGAVGGAVVGNQLARQNDACDNTDQGYQNNGYQNNGYQSGRAYRDPAAYYGSDPQEDRYMRRHHHHSDGYIRYQNDMAADANAYGRDTAYRGSNADGRSYHADPYASQPAYSNSASDGRTWRNANGQMCSWRDDTYREGDGDVKHRWVQDCQ